MTNSSLTHFVRKRGENLTTIELGSCSFATNEVLGALAAYSCYSLKHFSVMYNENITDDSVIALLANCRYLELVGLSYCTNVTDAVLRFLQALPGDNAPCKHLINLFIQGCPLITADAINELLAFPPRPDLIVYAEENEEGMAELDDVDEEEEEDEEEEG